jgi:hypothetical protein
LQLRELMTEATKLAAAMESAVTGDRERYRPLELQFSGRLSRSVWALSPGAKVIQDFHVLGDGGALFQNTTAKHDVELSTHRRPEGAGSEPAPFRVFFVEAEEEDNGSAPWVLGWLQEEELVRLGNSRNREVKRCVLLDPERVFGNIKLRKFTYESGEVDLDELADLGARVVRAYRMAGYEDPWIRTEVVNPLFENATAPAMPYGYNMIAGTVAVPAGALRAAHVGSDGTLTYPILVNLHYEWEGDTEGHRQENYHSYCCRLDAIDPIYMLPENEYGLLVGEVIEGRMPGESYDFSELDPWTSQVADYFVTVAGVPDPSVPGDDEEAARVLLGSTVFPLLTILTAGSGDALEKHLVEEKGLPAARAAWVRRVIDRTRTIVQNNFAEKAMVP